jgi:hypothetical protein
MLFPNRLFSCEILHKLCLRFSMMLPLCGRGCPYELSTLYTFEALEKFHMAMIGFPFHINPIDVCQETAPIGLSGLHSGTSLLSTFSSFPVPQASLEVCLRIYEHMYRGFTFTQTKTLHSGKQGNILKQKETIRS